MAKARILVVEDEVLIAAAIEKVLEESGYFCAGLCRDGAAAETYLRSASVDGVLLDIFMEDHRPTYNFCGLLEALGVPFAFVTGISQEAIPEEWRDRPYCGKPFDDEGILRVLSEMLNNQSDQARPELDEARKGRDCQ